MAYPGIGNVIRLRVEDSFGVVDTDSSTVTIYDNYPIAAFTANPNPAACNQPIDFNARHDFAGAVQHASPQRFSAKHPCPEFW